MPPTTKSREDVLAESTAVADRIARATGQGTFKQGVGVIPVDAIENPQPAMELPEVQPDPALVDGSLTATQKFLQEQQAIAQEAKQAESVQTDAVRQMQNALLGRGSEQLQLEQDAGLYDRRKTLNELNSRISTFADDLTAFDEDTFLGEEAMRLDAAGRDITKGAFGAAANQRRLQRAITRTGQASKLRAMVASSQLLQDNIQVAQAEINRALDIKYGVMEQALEYETQFLNRRIASADSAQRNALEARHRVIEQEEQAIFDAKKLVEAAAMAGASPSDVEALFDIEDPNEQANGARKLLSKIASQDRAFEMESRNIQRAIAGEQLKKLREKPTFQRNTQVIDQGGRKLLIDSDSGELIRDFGVLSEEVLGVDELTFAIDTEKINSIDALKSHKGLNSSVGTNPLARIGPIDYFSGEGADFVASVDQLTKALTIDNLASAKERGATFGALSDNELKLLADSASKINSWRRKNDDGTTKLYKAAESDFIAELDKISNFKKLDAYLRGEKSGYWEANDPVSIGVIRTDDGHLWAENGDGTLTKLR